MRFRKKPIVIEAIQWTGNNFDEVNKLMKYTCIDENPNGEEIVIVTLEGDMKANIGDWIIKGVKGEFYPCKPDIFEETYEEVDE